MKLAILRLGLRGHGGAETTLHFLIQGLAAAGHQILVFSGDPGPPPEGNQKGHVTFVRVPVWGRKSLRLLSFALNCRRLLAGAGVDLIFSLERTLKQDVYRAGDGCHREWLARRRAHLSLPGRLLQPLSPFHHLVLWLERRLFADKGLQRIIVNSRQVLEELRRHYQVPQERCRIIYNGLDRRVFRPPSPAEKRALREGLGAAPETRIILFVGSGFARKGLSRLLKAAAGLSASAVQVWVVGKGSERPYLAGSRGLGIEKRVRFWGPRREVAPFYQAADLFVLPTLYDPCSNAVLEALGCGLPCLTTDGNGAAEFIVPGVNGEVLSASAPLSRWVGALKNWLSRCGEPEAARAATDSVAHLSWERTIAQTLEVLEEARAMGGPRAAGSRQPLSFG